MRLRQPASTFRWENSHCIETLLAALSVLPIPVYLAPDANVIRYLTRVHNVGPLWTAELKRAPLSKIEKTLHCSRKPLHTRDRQ